MLILLDIGVLLAQNLYVFQGVQLLLGENLCLTLQTGQLRNIVLVFDSAVLVVVSDGGNRYLNVFDMLLHVVDIFLRFLVRFPLPLDLILDHLTLLVSDFVVIEGVLEAPDLELCVCQPALEAVSFLYDARPLPLGIVEPPSLGLDVVRDILNLISQPVI